MENKEGQGRNGDIQRQEDKRLVGLLLGAGAAGGSVEVAVRFVVVLGGEDEGREPSGSGPVSYMTRMGKKGEGRGEANR